MKKLLVLAAVIVAGVAANAASFKWTAANIYGSDGTTKWAGDVSLYAYAASADVSSATLVDTFSISTAGSVSSTFSSDSLTGGNYYNFYFVIEDNGKTFTSTTKENVQALATQTSNITFGNMQTATKNASNWAAVPEPTSGLLMLLGMAGLALRRRRA